MNCKLCNNDGINCNECASGYYRFNDNSTYICLS